MTTKTTVPRSKECYSNESIRKAMGMVSKAQSNIATAQDVLKSQFMEPRVTKTPALALIIAFSQILHLIAVHLLRHIAIGPSASLPLPPQPRTSLTLGVELAIYIAASLIATWAIQKWRRGYAIFLSLGPGGTPYNALGYTMVSIKSIFSIDPLSTPKIPEDLAPQNGFLNDLPRRSDPRPQIRGVAPQRQVEQNAAWKTVQSAIDNFVDTSPDLKQSTSFIEKRGPAMFPRDECSVRPSERIFGAEIGHVHEFDGSLHLNLHPRDVATVIASGWGERHPLARGERMWFAYFRDFWRLMGYKGARPPVAVGWTLIYAPRTEEERQVVLEIVKAAAEWVTDSQFEA